MYRNVIFNASAVARSRVLGSARQLHAGRACGSVLQVYGNRLSVPMDQYSKSFGIDKRFQRGFTCRYNTTETNETAKNTESETNTSSNDAAAEGEKINEEENKNADENKGSDEAGDKAEKAEVITDADRIADLEKQVKDMKDKVIRSYAEEENVRRIAKRDIDNARNYANESFGKAMLEVADDLERALNNAPKERDDASNILVEGIQMTEKNLQKIFQKYGIVKFGAIDEAFDPSIHNALFNMPPTEGQTTDMVGQIIKNGYKMKDRVIRAAEVGVKKI